MSVSAPVKLTIKDYKSELHNDWCPGCLAPRTQIVLADGTLRAIEDVAVGDLVVGHDGRSHRVSEVMSHWHPDSMHRLTIASAGSVVLTADHPVYIARVDRTAGSMRYEWTLARD